MLAFQPKYAGEDKDYAIDFSARLGADAIASYVLSVDEGSITLHTESNTTSVVQFWIASGVAQESCVIDCKVTTNSSPPRTYETQVRIDIIQGR